MAEKIVLEVEVNNEGGVQATKNLKAQLKEAQLEAQRLADKYGETSKEAIAAYKNTANVKEQIADMKQTIDAFHPEAKFNAMAEVASGLAGGFAAAEGAMALFGAESEDLQKQMLKVQAALSLSQGINSIMGLGDGFRNLSLVLQQTTIYTTLASAAQGVYNFVVGAGTVAMVTFRAALVASGIGAAIALMFTLVANWKQFVGWVEKSGVALKEAAMKFEFVSAAVGFLQQKFSILANAIIKLLEDLNILDTEQENLAQAEAERAASTVENLDKISNARKRDIEIAKAQGKSAKELRDMEIQMLLERKAAYEDLVKKKQKAGEEITADDKESLAQAQHEHRLAVLENIRLTAEEEKAKLEEKRKSWEKSQEKIKEQRQKELELDRQIQDERIKLIKDEQERELAEINLGFSRRIEAIKGNGAKEKELRSLIEQEQQIAVEAVKKKYEDERLAKEAAALLKKSEDGITQLNADLINLQTEGQATYDKEREILDASFQQKLEFEKLSDAELNLAYAEYNQKRSEIDKKQKEESVKREQEIFSAKIQISQNLANGLNALADLSATGSKKQLALQKAAAVAQFGIDTAKAISSTVAGATAAAAAGGPAAPFLIATYITSGIATVLASMATAKKALQSAGASAPDVGGGGGSAATPAVRFSETGNSVTRLNPQTEQRGPVDNKVYVAETDISRTQNRVKTLENSATF